MRPSFPARFFDSHKSYLLCALGCGRTGQETGAAASVAPFPDRKFRSYQATKLGRASVVHVVIWRSRAALRLAAWLAGAAIGAMAWSPVHADDSITTPAPSSSSPVQATDATASSDPAPDKSG